MTSLGLKVTPANLALLSLFASSAFPVMASFLFIIFRTVFGTLYPAYASYKAVKTKNVREYVKWMMYWIVFAFLSCTEVITDIFLAWFPFYCEIKILILLWLLSPHTNGSSILYRKFVHPQLMKHEDKIDECIERAKADGYNTMADLVTTGGRLVTRAVQEAAIPLVNRVFQEAAGGGRFNMTRSYSTNDINIHDGPTREYYRPITNVDEGVEIMDLDSDTDDFSLGSTASGVRKDDLSSGYSGSEAQPVPSTSNCNNVGVTGSKSGRKSPGRGKTKAVSFEQPGSSQYATLPRTSKRNTRKKATNDK